ncbi:hypothetical protein [Methylocystis parvus]|uniref:hypothetical protein n=1 Tax=Methylocystis parvus TaxID=134 RepID=UPI003C731BDB
MKAVILVGAALTLLMTFDNFRRTKLLLFEYPVLILLATLGMMLMDLGGQPHRALSRTRADVAGALRRRRLQRATTYARANPASNISCLARSPRA